MYRRIKSFNSRNFIYQVLEFPFKQLNKVVIYYLAPFIRETFYVLRRGFSFIKTPLKNYFFNPMYDCCSFLFKSTKNICVFIKDCSVSFVKTTYNFFKSPVTAIYRFFRSLFTSIFSPLKSFCSYSFNKLNSGIEFVFTTLSDIIYFITDKLSAISNFLFDKLSATTRFIANKLSVSVKFVFKKLFAISKYLFNNTCTICKKLLQWTSSACRWSTRYVGRVILSVADHVIFPILDALLQKIADTLSLLDSLLTFFWKEMVFRILRIVESCSCFLYRRVLAPVCKKAFSSTKAACKFTFTTIKDFLRYVKINIFDSFIHSIQSFFRCIVFPFSRKLKNFTFELLKSIIRPIYRNGKSLLYNVFVRFLYRSLLCQSFRITRSAFKKSFNLFVVEPVKLVNKYSRKLFSNTRLFLTNSFFPTTSRYLKNIFNFSSSFLRKSFNLLIRSPIRSAWYYCGEIATYLYNHALRPLSSSLFNGMKYVSNNLLSPSIKFLFNSSKCYIFNPLIRAFRFTFTHTQSLLSSISKKVYNLLSIPLKYLFNLAKSACSYTWKQFVWVVGKTMEFLVYKVVVPLLINRVTTPVYRAFQSILLAIKWIFVGDQRAVRHLSYGLDIRPAVQVLANPIYYKLKDNQEYGIWIQNRTGCLCDCKITIDGASVGQFRLLPGKSYLIERPSNCTQRFTFHQNIARGANNENCKSQNDPNLGVVTATFIPEMRAIKMAKSGFAFGNMAGQSRSRVSSNAAPNIPHGNVSNYNDQDLSSFMEDDAAAEQELTFGATGFNGAASNQQFLTAGAIKLDVSRAVTITTRLVVAN